MSGFNGQRVSAAAEHQHAEQYPADASTNGGDREDDDLGSGSEHGGDQSYGQQGLGDSDAPGEPPSPPSITTLVTLPILTLFLSFPVCVLDG